MRLCGKLYKRVGGDIIANWFNEVVEEGVPESWVVCKLVLIPKFE